MKKIAICLLLAISFQSHSMQRTRAWIKNQKENFCRKARRWHFKRNKGDFEIRHGENQGASLNPNPESEVQALPNIQEYPRNQRQEKIVYRTPAAPGVVMGLIPGFGLIPQLWREASSRAQSASYDDRALGVAFTGGALLLDALLWLVGSYVAPSQEEEDKFKEVISILLKGGASLDFLTKLGISIRLNWK